MFIHEYLNSYLTVSDPWIKLRNICSKALETQIFGSDLDNLLTDLIKTHK